MSQLIHHNKDDIPELNLDQAEQTSPFRPMALLLGRDKGCVIKPPECPLKSRCCVPDVIQGPEKPNRAPWIAVLMVGLSSHWVGGDRINVVLKVIWKPQERKIITWKCKLCLIWAVPWLLWFIIVSSSGLFFFLFQVSSQLKKKKGSGKGRSARAELQLPGKIYGSFYPNVKHPSTGQEY